MDKINVNIEIIGDILNKLSILKEETEIHVMNLQKTIDTAEMRGWNDKKFIEFKDSALPIIKNGRDMIRGIEEELIPMLKQIQTFIEEY